MKTSKGVMAFMAENAGERESVDPDFEKFLEAAFADSPVPARILCAYCGLAFVSNVIGAKCHCPEGQKTKAALVAFAERKEEG